jgi:predicted small lipoprotein YifL
MSRRCPFLFLLFLLAVLAGCGKKGPIVAPMARAPQAVEDLAVSQRGSNCLLTWTNPSAYLDGSPLSGIAEVEIWLAKEDRAGEGAQTTWTVYAFAEEAALIGRLGQEDLAASSQEGKKAPAGLTYRYALAADDPGNKILTFSVRVSDLKKRTSQFATPRSLEAMAPLVAPRNVRAVVFEDHIQVSWEGQEQPKEEAAPVMMPAMVPLMIPLIPSPIIVPVAPATIPAMVPVMIPLISSPITVPVALETTASTKPPPKSGFNVFRSEGENPAVQKNTSLLETGEFQDKDFLFGRTYRYFVRSAQERKPPLESDDSEAVEVTAKDVFPPAAPTGLTAIGGPGFISLSWEGGREPDLASYRVWRKPAGEGEFTPIATLTNVAGSFSDLKVEKNQRYEYAISALDAAGNESPKSATAIGLVRDEPV